MSSAPRGLAPREGLECWLTKMGRTGPLVKPRHRPQAGKSGDPRSQNANSMYIHVRDQNDNAMYALTRWAPACAVSSFPLWCKGGKRRHGVPRHQAKVSISVQRDQDQQDGKTEVTMEPKAASPPEPFAGEDRFCQDKLY